MSEQGQPQKNSKAQVIMSHAFFLLWAGAFVTFACKDFGILPNHWLIYLAILSVILVAWFKLNDFSLSSQSQVTTGENPAGEFSDKLTNDICTGIAPHGYWWNNNSTTTHTHDPYISTTTHTHDPYISTTTYTSYDRDR